MQANPKVSVIVPVYNTEEYIEDCLRSIFNQTYKNIEIIVVDDASTDRTPAKLEQYTDSIHVISHKSNGGPGKARNTAMDYLSGDLVTFLDSDDFYFYERIIEDIVRIFTGDIYIFNGIDFKSETLRERHFKLEQRYFNKNGVFKKYYHHLMNVISPVMKVYSSEFLRKNNIRFPEGIYGEDVEFWIKCLLVTQEIRYINLFAYHRRCRENSIMMSESSKNILDRIDNLDSLLNLTSENIPIYNYIVNNYIKFVLYLINKKNDPELLAYFKVKLDWLMQKYN